MWLRVRQLSDNQNHVFPYFYQEPFNRYLIKGWKRGAVTSGSFNIDCLRRSDVGFLGNPCGIYSNLSEKHRIQFKISFIKYTPPFWYIILKLHFKEKPLPVITLIRIFASKIFQIIFVVQYEQKCFFESIKKINEAIFENIIKCKIYFKKRVLSFEGTPRYDTMNQLPTTFRF